MVYIYVYIYTHIHMTYIYLYMTIICCLILSKTINTGCPIYQNKGVFSQCFTEGGSHPVSLEETLSNRIINYL